MGAITEMILEGILCDKCAGFIDENPVGYPRTCQSCLREYEKEDKKFKKEVKNETNWICKATRIEGY